MVFCLKNFIILLISYALSGVLIQEKAAASEIRIGFSEDALTLDPANHRSRETQTIIRNMYDGLLTRTQRMEVVPEIAESWKQIDEVTYEFKIRHGVKFHNGELLTVEDIKFTLERLTQEGAIGGKTSPRKTLLPDIERVDIVDAQTLRIVLRTTWPHFLAMLPLQEVVSRSSVIANRPSGLRDIANGTGPFKLVEWRKGEAIVMQRFEGYYGGSSEIPPVGSACVDRVVFHIVPNDEERVAALLNGKVDIIDNLPIASLNKVMKSDTVSLHKTPGTRTFFVTINLKRPPFQDIRVRKALNHAINRESLIKQYLKGGAFAVNGVLSPFAFGYNPDLTEYTYNPAKSRELLAAAGFDNDRTIVFDADENMHNVAISIAEMLAKVGIKTSIRTSPFNEIKKKWLSSNDQAGDIWLASWGNSSLDPIGIFVPKLRSGGSGNYSGYSNKKVDTLLDAAATEVELTKRAKLYGDAEQIINKDVPWVFLWVPEEFYGVSNRIKGWRPSADGRINLHDVCVD